jgi:predicted PurR-regulated permease PerM
MNPQALTKAIVQSVLSLIGLFALVYSLYLIQEVIIYLLVAAILSLVGKPIVTFLSKKLRFPNTLAVIATLLIQLLVVIGLLTLFVPVLINQGEQLSILEIEDLSGKAMVVLDRMNEAVFQQFPQLSEYINIKAMQSRWFESIDLNFLPYFIEQIGDAFGSFSIGLFSVLFLSFFFLKDQRLFRRGILTLIADKKEQKTLDSIDQIEKLLTRYFIGILFQLSILFVVYAIALMLGGIKNALIIAFLCALFNIIPYVGPIIGAAVMLLLTLIGDLNLDFASDTLPKLLYVLGGVLIGQLIDNFFSQPFIYAKSVRSHPIEIFLVILCSGLLFGIVGMIVAVPVYTSIKVILKVFYREHSWVQKLTKDL